MPFMPLDRDRSATLDRFRNRNPTEISSSAAILQRLGRDSPILAFRRLEERFANGAFLKNAVPDLERAIAWKQ